MPALAKGGANKQPLTPKIATTRSAAPHHQTVTVSTPLPRRSQRPESSLSGYGTAHKERDDFASPVSAFLNNNITPRSGSRQSRVDSANSTPNGTPQPDRHDTWEANSGLGISGPGADNRRPSVAASEAANMARPAVEPKFFYASEATRAAPQVAQPPRPFVAPQKQSTFVYANGNSVSEGRQSGTAPTFTPVLASQPSQDSLMSKFVYADGTSDAQSPVRATFAPPPGPGSVVSTSSKMVSSRPGTGVSASGYMAQRPPSPVKHPSFPPAMTGNGHVFAPLRSPVLIPSVGSVPDMRRTSADSAPRLAGGAHSRTGSIVSNLTMAEAPAVARLMSTHGSYPSSESSSPSTFSNPGFTLITSNPATSGFASLLQAADDFAEDEEDEDEEEEEEEGLEEGEEDYYQEGEAPQSPGKASSQENQLNELVASARRERKVQDLQITNASLEAINRTLERQLRKQTAELRRYRRLSRSGRISLGPSTGRSRVTSDSTVDGGGLARAGLGLDDLSEEDSELEEEEDEEDYSDSDLDSGELSPNAAATRDFRHRRQDEQRLQLDLSKHQQLLIDSQKMNQSLKRCLGWTEELIKEGKRALEYQVRVSEVNIGGRVLNPEDMEANDDESEIVGDETTQELKIEPQTAAGANEEDEQSRGKDPQDRDSGIELPTDGG
ncbi:hypothetical protein GQ53DRAFT_784303 [Thozetella sp. PMI_491]|nr:hypothetical protein GQ53DRAFT_784303 [Thozetella sp. PMI_491]